MSLQQAQEQMQTALLTTYLANLAFLSEYDKDLYHRIDSLSIKINENKYKERFILEFLEEKAEFDIFDKNKKNYIYNGNYINKLNSIDNIDFFDSKGQFTTLEPLLHKEYLKNDNLLIKHSREFSKIFQDDLSSVHDRKIKEINKFIFLGTLLARHIPKIVEKTKAKNFFVCEENLEIFRLSLFVFDYTLLVNNGSTVIFSIMEEEPIFEEKFRVFYTNNYLDNHTLKYYSTNYNVEKYYEQISTNIISNSSLLFDYEKAINYAFIPSLEKINKRNHLCANLKTNNMFLKNKNVLLVGGGPSFSENIEWLKKYQDSFLIVAMGATYKKLLDNDIRVDLISTLESSEETVSVQFPDENLDLLKNIIIIESSITHKKLDRRFFKDNLFVNPNFFAFYKDMCIQSGFSVGEITAILLLQLGVNHLYLLGLDFSINQETGAVHSKGSQSYTNKFDLNKIENPLDKGSFSLHHDLIYVKNNRSENVLTNRALYLSAKALADNLESLKDKSFKVKSFARNAVLIKNVEYIEIKNFKIKNKLEEREIKGELKKFLLEKSRKNLEKDEKKLLFLEKKYLLKIGERLQLLEEFNNLNDLKKFYFALSQDLTTLSIRLTFSSYIFKHYFNTWLPYISYCFNDKNIKDEKRKLFEIQKKLKMQIEEILKIYIDTLSKILH